MTYFNQDDRQGGRKSFGGGKRSFGDRRGEDRKMYPATCHECGRDCQVPFFPDGSKPVYCSSCFQKNQGDFEQKRPSFGGRQFEERKSVPSQPQSQNQYNYNDLLVSINSKLERMLTLMAAANKPVPIPKKIVAEPIKKVKKAVKKTEKA